ncbi:MAG: 3-methylcrotonyl-CoA carboxylase alpha subunit [Sphingomonadales bacterium]|jgi:3-methylcrotonyl-CoA carboxylase alpha subunit|nr:3-methylcrotonyl-CoA carboxylase alpha subunit [Sphingomonadales bacterium]
MIGSLLIANRGEIACRIIRTARRLGVRTVAVYSDSDRQALHVREADAAVPIGPSPARESYLAGEKIIAAAKETGAEAIHPGYGFLSENAEFAEAVEAAGLVWVGPKPASIRAMGLKDAAKTLMQEAGVPVTPGYLGEDQAPERLQREAEAIGFPVLIKAVAGGGGKGMRRVNAAGEFQEMLASCKRESAAAFGDDKVLIEKYVERPRHIEVQVFGDTHGNFVHLFERDCSLQRRHQKVIEEAPAPGMNAATRAAVCDAAVKAAKAVDYVGAGTIEFIADASEGLKPDRIWFMEMNTRLQVEHPVTEAITGQDLVEWQLRVASGEALPLKQDQLSIDGWAVEARLYAEDASKDFLPAIGKAEIFHIARQGVRVDSALEEGDRVTPDYDPMIAKLIAHASTRDEAIETLAGACGDVWAWPLKTNAPFLWRALDHPDFRAGDVDTGFIARHWPDLVPPPEPSLDRLCLGAAALVLAYSDPDAPAFWDQSLHKALRGYASPGAVWCQAVGFRLNASPAREIAFEAEGVARTLELPKRWDQLPIDAERHGDGIVVFHEGEALFVRPPSGGGGGAGAAVGDGAIVSPMPGRVIAVEVGEGDKVAKGARLVTLEAMKMEHNLVAPFDGVVAELAASEGAQVTEGTLLVRVEKE